MASDSQARWQTATVVETRSVAKDIRRIVLQTSVPQAVAPGAHVDVKVGIGKRDETRSYSIVEGLDRGHALAITVHLSPESRGGSRFMHSLRAGDELSVTQPLQNFPLRRGASRFVLVAGGVGITAIYGMALALRDAGGDYELRYVGRSRGAMAYLDELTELHGAALKTHIAEEGTRLDVPALVSEVNYGSEVEMYVCGPMTLMDALRRQWSSVKLPVSKFRFETFGNSGWYAPQPFTVCVPRLGITTEVARDQSLLDALELAGADMMSDCRKGECGLCQVAIIGLDGQIDHRDVFFSDDEKRNVQKLCTCVSRAVTNDHENGPPGNPRGLPAVLTIELP